MCPWAPAGECVRGAVDDGRCPLFPSGMQMVVANPLIALTAGHRPICAGDYVEHFDPDLVRGATLNGSGMALGLSRRNLPLWAGQGARPIRGWIRGLLELLGIPRPEPAALTSWAALSPGERISVALVRRQPGLQVARAAEVEQILGELLQAQQGQGGEGLAAGLIQIPEPSGQLTDGESGSLLLAADLTAFLSPFLQDLLHGAGMAQLLQGQSDDHENLLPAEL